MVFWQPRAAGRCTVLPSRTLRRAGGARGGLPRGPHSRSCCGRAVWGAQRPLGQVPRRDVRGGRRRRRGCAQAGELPGSRAAGAADGGRRGATCRCGSPRWGSVTAMRRAGHLARPSCGWRQFTQDDGHNLLHRGPGRRPRVEAVSAATLLGFYRRFRLRSRCRSALSLRPDTTGSATMHGGTTPPGAERELSARVVAGLGPAVRGSQPGAGPRSTAPSLEFILGDRRGPAVAVRHHPARLS